MEKEETKQPEVQSEVNKTEEITPMISIVIPHYNEPVTKMLTLLSSINIQLAYNFDYLEVIIVDDCSTENLDALDEITRIPFNFKIHIVALDKNVGPGLCREAGKATAKGEYILFCDSDDSLYDCFTLVTVARGIQQLTTKPDILRTDWVEEKMGIDGGVYYETHTSNNTWLHGIFFNRKFLEDNDIHFSKDLRTHEDSYFVTVASALAKERRKINLISYIWRYHADSMTRSDGHIYEGSKHSKFIIATRLALNEIMSKISQESLEYRVSQILLYHYVFLNLPEWSDEDMMQYYDEAADTLINEFENLTAIYNNVSDEKKEEILNKQIEKHWKDMPEEMRSLAAANEWLYNIGFNITR